MGIDITVFLFFFCCCCCLQPAILAVLVLGCVTWNLVTRVPCLDAAVSIPIPAAWRIAQRTPSPTERLTDAVS